MRMTDRRLIQDHFQINAGESKEMFLLGSGLVLDLSSSCGLYFKQILLLNYYKYLGPLLKTFFDTAYPIFTRWSAGAVSRQATGRRWTKKKEGQLSLCMSCGPCRGGETEEDA